MEHWSTEQIKEAPRWMFDLASSDCFRAWNDDLKRDYPRKVRAGFRLRFWWATIRPYLVLCWGRP